MTRPTPITLLSRECIAARVARMGAQITQDYAGARLLLVPVLKGALPFAADLMRAIDLDLEIECVTAASYGTAQHSCGKVRLDGVPRHSIRGQHVLLVEDIVDTGLTVGALCRDIAEQGPASLKVCALLDKPARRQVEVHIDYVGFEIENHFVVGYGLDHRGLYRNLPYIGICPADSTTPE